VEEFALSVLDLVLDHVASTADASGLAKTEYRPAA
jgi:hypothetical protein